MTLKTRIFVFEGVDMTGKSTVARYVYEQLSVKFPNRVSLYRAPGGTENAEKLREASRTMNLSPFSQGLLFLSCLSDLAEQILKDIKEEKFIVLDRWLWSTMAYQLTYCSSKKAALLKAIIEEIHLRGVTSFYLSVTPEVLEERIAANTRPGVCDRFETSTPEYRKTILDAYNQIFTPGRHVPGGLIVQNSIIIDTVANDLESVKVISLGRVFEAVTQ